MPAHRVHGLDAERNRNRRRDKKIKRKKSGMRVDDSARDLAQFKASKYGKFVFMTNELLKEPE